MREAIQHAGRMKKFTAQTVLREINKKENAFKKQVRQSYLLITNISIKYFEMLKWIRISDCSIIFKRYIPQKYNRGEIPKKARRFIHSDFPKDYTVAIVKVRARSVYEASSKAIDTIDLLRAIWNFYYNQVNLSRMTFGKPGRINQIILGPFHTLHNLTGELATETFWYRPNYEKISTCKDISKDWDDLRKYEQLIRKNISKSKYRQELQRMILKYSQALDESDLNKSFLELWSLLESLTFNPQTSKDAIKRAIFFFQNRDYHNQTLRILKDYRNKYVHESEQSVEIIESLVYQLKRYVEKLLTYHIFEGPKYSSVEEMEQFLDLPDDISLLKKRVKLYKKGISFLET
ncbi:MAG: hypothetical protein AMJ92_05015 [candidate division Zixibacteria bacterium SM23_81]|nr:MAG: hypothetical protein AMJ92_05015 [candidate division Zixibacteria bacterium SM23_81]